jgi:VCBS repeat-containing protein
VVDGNGGSASATVTVTIEGENDAPEAVDDTGTVSEDGPTTSIVVLGNDTDVDGDTLTVDSLDTTGLVGVASINADGTVSYDPAGEFESLGVGESTTQSFVYTVVDGNGGSASATVTVTIEGENDAPVALDDAGVVDAAGPPVVIDVLANDSDVDGDTLSVDSLDATGLVGVASINADGTVSYDPDGQFESLGVGESTTQGFGYTVVDGNGGSADATVTVTIEGENDAPEAEDDTVTVGEDGPEVCIAVLANDSDVDDGDVLRVDSLDTAGLEGTARINAADGTVCYDPAGQFESLAAGELATQTFGYTVVDGNGASASATVTVTIIGQNDDPDAADDTGTVSEDGPATIIDVLSNDSDIDGDTLSVASLDTTGLTGVASINPDGTVSYDPAGQFESLGADASATETFGYTVVDGNGGSADATVTVTIEGENDAPEAVDDVGVVDAAGPELCIAVLANDSDVDDGDVLRVASLDTADLKGTARINTADDTVCYDPAGQFESLGDDETATEIFSYTVTDDRGGRASAGVVVRVGGENQDPIAEDDTGTVSEDGPATSIAVLGNDSDPDGDPLSVESLDTTGLVGTVSINPDGTVSYDPAGQFESLAAGELATQSFGYTVVDGNGGSASATVTVTIEGENDAPAAVDDTGTVSEDGPATSIDVLGNDSDVDGDPLSVDSLDTTGLLGTASINADGTVSYDPGGQFESLGVGDSTTQSFGYTVVDGNGGSARATVTVTIGGENDAPVALDDADVVDAAGPPVVIDVLGNDSDVDGDTLSVDSLDTSALVGVAVINADGTVSYDPNGQFDGLTETQTETFIYTVVDGSGGSDSATVTVTIEGAADLCVPTTPLASTQQASVSEDGPPAVVLVLPGDCDGLFVDASVARGSAEISADSKSISFDPDGQFEDLPSGDSRTEILRYTVADDDGNSVPGEMTIIIEGANDAPEIEALADFEVLPGDLVEFTIRATDIDGDPLVIAGGDLPTGAVIDDRGDGTARFSWIPDPAQGGIFTITVTVTDSGAPIRQAVSTVDIAVAPLNRPPMIELPPIPASIPEGTPVELLFTASDPDGDALQFLLAGLPAGALFETVNDEQVRVLWTPGSNQSGNYPLQLTVIDDGIPAASGTVPFTLTVGDVNRPPSLLPIGDRTVADGDTLRVDLVAIDPDGDALVFEEPTGLPAGATFTDNGDGTAALSWSPQPGQSDVYRIEVIVTDAGTPPESAADVFSISVEDVNRPPELVRPLLDRTVLIGETLSIDISATDPDPEVLEFLVDGLPAQATLTPIGSRAVRLEWTPDGGEQGDYTVVVTVQDAAIPTGEDIEMFTVTVPGEAPGAVGGLEGRARLQRVGLLWDPVPDAEAYVVLRRLDGETSASEIGRSEFPVFSDDIPAGVAGASYSVFAVNAFGEGPVSDPVRVEPAVRRR